jgi:pimeloyl-ACP methyl ester carboxylesterase
LGQGATDVPATGPVDFAAYYAHLSAFLDCIAPPAFHLVLHDFGGVLGLRWTCENPERVRSLVLLSTTVRASLRVNFFLGANFLLGRRMLEWALPYTIKGGEPIDRRLFHDWAAPWTRRRLWRGADHFARRHFGTLRPSLEHVQCPALLVWGENDNVFPLSHAREILRRIPNSRLETIPRCGHWLPLDAPERVADLIARHCGAANQDR